MIVYPIVLPLTISHCAEIRRPSPPRNVIFAIKTDWLVMPRKPVADNDEASIVVEKATNTKAL